ncbi:multi-sensor signal transduction histidine kinase [Candidatus Koribacter versatilis Ellin345]|uniref:histidine kinase n=1 Tax=Koribacter versatilis (strain Ellin345) TaxID=204669 RepID=Q1IK87_KORVE|nr:PAS domain S-box protein [Candidatus Koribacter versatilis]ABF42713.1 multi-sensor signal transduction histidine kinase [Candidatus Koribacter versatilis Ellin345]
MVEQTTLQNGVSLEASISEGGASLESILCTEDLQSRPSRPPDCEKENRALVKLISALADSPSTIFQTLAETIQDITQCDSAGLSLLTKDGKSPHVEGQRFYWPAICGMWGTHVGGGTPRNFGPCGDVLDQNRTLLFTHFERRYPYLMPVIPAAEECLLVPFYVDGKAVGTIWGIMHSDRRKFDAEDNRVMASLGKFASSAYRAWTHIEELKIEVAEREKAEAEVRQLASGLEARIHRLVGANVVGIVMWNLEGAITGANEAFLQMVHYDQDDIASDRVRWKDLTPVEWRNRDEQAIAELKVSSIFRPYEKEFLRRDRTRVPVLLGGTLFEHGGNDGVAFVLDLTEQKRTEEALRRSEADLAEGQKLSRTGTWRWNIRTGEVTWSREFFAILGFDPGKDKASYELHLERIHPEDRSKIEEGRWAAIKERRHFESEYRLLIPGGLIKCLHCVGHCLVDQSGDVEYIGAVMDITERKAAEEERERLRQAHRVIVQTATDAMVSADESGVIQFANPAAMKVFGYDPKELIGKPLTILMPEYLRKAHENGYGRYLATGQRHLNWEGTQLTGLRKNGQEFPVEVSFGELTINGQRVFTGFIRDTTERKQAEETRERLRRVQADLEHLTRVSTMGELTASLAHEVNQPLTAITNNGSACLRLLANQNLNPEVLRQALEEIVADGRRASAVIARIRGFIKKAPAEKTELDVNEVIREVLALVCHQLHKNHVSVEYQTANALPFVWADRIQLQQVLLNLIMNSIEAMTGAANQSRVLGVESRIDESGSILVAVRDSGTGLNSETDRVFTPFFTTKANGLGLGLPISRSLIEVNGGRLWATSNSPCGAVFSFTLPAAGSSS